MSSGMITYLVGMLAMFVAQRMLDGTQGAQTSVTVIAILAVGTAAALRFRKLRAATNSGLRLAHRLALMFLLVGAASLVMYAATTDMAIRSLTLGEEAEARWLGVWRSMWPLVWLLGTLPLLVVDYAAESSPVMMPTRRARDLAMHGLVAALGIGIVFPINYIASQEKTRWDLAYFKTPVPGSATHALTQSLEAPVAVRIFMPPSSEVAQELLAYFEPIKGPNLSVEVIDAAADPRLAKQLAVRDNGVVTFTVGDLDALPTPDDPEGDSDAPKPLTRTIRINPDIDKAKNTLKKIDGKVQKLLIELGQGERVAYVTTGHGELTWKSGGGLPTQIKGFRDELKQLGFTVKPLGFRQHLAEAVPEDADFVVIPGPTHPLQPLEVQAIQAYLESGGSLLIAMEPKGRRAPQARTSDPLVTMVQEVIGLKFEDGLLADERNILAMGKNVQDRFLIFTNAFSTHGSSKTLASEGAALFTPISGHLTDTDAHGNSVNIIVRSLASTWADLNENGKFDADAGETKVARNLVAAVTGGNEGVTWRVIVTADALMISDWALGNEKVPSGTVQGVGFRGNKLLVGDMANWLIGAESLSGTTESEEDVLVKHTKEDQIWWFYITVLGVPLMVFGLGALRIRMRTVTRKSTGGAQ